MRRVLAGFSVFIRLALAANTTETSLVGWVPDPDGRGTLSLISSCVITFVLCVWCALHLNVPPPDAPSSWFALEKTKWVLLGIFAPELVVATAASQYFTAKWLKDEIDRDFEYRKPKGPNTTKGCSSAERWSMSQCYFVVTGGCVVNIPWMNVDDDRSEKSTKVTVTPAGMRLLSFLGRLPKIEEPQVRDKSKADWLAKSVVCVQATWMVTQVVGRLIQGLPVSLLEINTCGHVICALVLYLFWWDKPLDVQDPTIVDYSDDLSLLFLCSAISGSNGIPHVRCFYYNFKGKVGNQLESLKSSDAVLTMSADGHIIVHAEMGIGTYGNKNIESFIGDESLYKIPPSKGRGCFVQHSFFPRTATECMPYLSPPYQDLPLRHGDMYCRRVRSSQQNPRHAGHVTLDPELIAKACGPLRVLWEECEKRPGLHRRLYFTIVQPLDQMDVGAYLCETEYLVPKMANFPALWNLSLGQVDLQKELLPSIFAFTALAYGGLHLAAWNDFYPSRFERISWITAALIIATSGAILWALYTLKMFIKPSREYVSSGGRKSRQGILYEGLTKSFLYFLAATFVLARIFIVVEAFISLRTAPKEMYLTPEWSNLLPHL